MERQSRQVKAGVGTVEAAQMVDSSPLLLEGQTQAAKERLARDGYLLLRNYLPTDTLSKVPRMHTLYCCLQHALEPLSCAGAHIFTG